MKKIIIIIILLLASFIITGCKPKEVDYSEYKFTDVRWTTEGDGDTEYLRFGSNGTYSHYCGCGNPVNSSDMCDGYTYNEKTKTIKLDCDSKYAITKIKILKSTEDVLILDFEGKKYFFEKDPPPLIQMPEVEKTQ